MLAFLPDGRLAIAPQQFMPFNPFLFVLIVDPNSKSEQRLPVQVSIPRGKWTEMSTAFAVSPDGRSLLLGVRSGRVYRWNLDAPKPDATLLEWKAHDSAVSGFAFAPDHRWLYTSSHDGRVKRWDLDAECKSAAESNVRGDPPPRLTGVAYWPAGLPAIFTHGAAGSQLLDPMTLAPLTDKDLAQSGWRTPSLPGMSGRLATHPSTGTIVMSDGGEAVIAYWERRICLPIATFVDDDLPETQRAHSWNIEGIAIHPSGMLAATVCPDEGKLKLWHLGTNDHAVSLPIAYARACAFSRDGRWLAVAGDHHTTIFEIGGVDELRYVGRRGLPIRAIGITADHELGTIAVRAHPTQSNLEHVVASTWNLPTELRETVLHQADLPVSKGRGRIVSTGARTAFALDDGKIHWHAKSPTKTTTEELTKCGHVRDLAIDAKGRFWTIEDNSKLLVRSTPSDKPRAIAIGRPGAGRKDIIGLKARSNYVAAGCDDGYLRIIRTSDGVAATSFACFNESEITILKESANTVHAVDVLADETRAIAGTEDGRLWLFRLPDGERLQAWRGHDDRVTSVCFDATGEWLASGGRDHQVRLWRRTQDRYELFALLRSPGARSVRQLVFSEDGSRLLALHEKETAVRVWRLDKLMEDYRNVGLSK
jgi:WD40 repeat protein